MARVCLVWLLLHTVSSNFPEFSQSYSTDSGQKTSPGFLVEYFSTTRNPYLVFEAGCDCVQCGQCPCPTCPGLAGNEDRYTGPDYGSPRGRGTVRVTSRVSSALEFNFQPNNGTDAAGALPEDWLGYFYPQQEGVFPNSSFIRTWGVRSSGIIKATPLKNRIRVAVVGSCWSYTLRLNTSTTGVSAIDNVQTSTRFFDIQSGEDTAFVLEFRMLCDSQTVQSLSVRNIPQRWIGPSRIFLSNTALTGDAGFTAFDTMCQLQGPPSLGTWKAFLWGTDFSTRFPANQLVYPLAHRVGTNMISVGNMTARDSSSAAQSIAYDSNGDTLPPSAVWINNGTGNCGGGWNVTAGLGSRILTSNTSYENWRLPQGTDSCATKNLFYCAEVFPAIADQGCTLDLYNNRLCSPNQPCRVDGDCMSGACVFGQCSVLNVSSWYCVANVNDTCTSSSSCGYGGICTWWTPTSKQCVIPTPVVLNATCVYVGYRPFAGQFAMPFSSVPPPGNVCPPGYSTNFSAVTGSYCVNQNKTGCCGSYMPCNISSCSFNTGVRLSVKPYHMVSSPSTTLPNPMVLFDPMNCYNQCKTNTPAVGSFASIYNNASGQWQCVCSASQVVKRSTVQGQHAWIVIPSSDQEYVPFTDLAVYNVIPQHNLFTTDVYQMQTFLNALNSTRSMFLPDAATFSDFFCVTTGIQCFNSQEELARPGDTVVGFNFFLPLWGLALKYSGYSIPILAGMRHLDLSMNPAFAPQVAYSTNNTLRTMDFLGTNASCVSLDNTNLSSLIRLAVPDGGCLGSIYLQKGQLPALQHLVLHQLYPGTLNINASQFQTLVLLVGTFPSTSSPLFTGSINLTLNVPKLVNFMSFGADFNTAAILPFNSTLNDLELVGVPNETTVAAFTNWISGGNFWNLTTLNLGGTDFALWNPPLAVNFTYPSLAQLNTLRIAKAYGLTLLIGASSLPALKVLTVREITRLSPKPMIDFLNEINCCAGRTNLVSIDFRAASLSGPIPSNRWNYTTYGYLNLAQNFLSPSYTPRDAPFDQGMLSTYLQNWSMIAGFPSNLADRVDLSRNPLLRGYGFDTATCKSESYSCAFPSTGFCTANTTLACTPFWLLEYFFTARAVTDPVVPLRLTSEALPQGPVRIFSVIYSTLRLPTLMCGWVGLGVTGNGYVQSAPLIVSNTTTPNVYLGRCDIDVGPTVSTLARFGVATNDSLVRWTNFAVSPNYDSSNSSSLFLAINISNCAAGSCGSVAACNDCTPGKYSSPGCNACTSCPVGFISPNNAANCTICANGTEADSLGTKCTTCKSGWASAFGLACTECPAGKYAANGSSCVSCDPGSAQPNNASTTCVTCAGGKFSNATGLANCMNCPIGRAVGSPGALECLPCANGTEAVVGGRTACSLCSPGTVYSTNFASTGCVNCNVGEQQPSDGQTECEPCPPGTASDVIGTSTCFNCTVGLYNPYENQTTCLSCDLGWYQNETGQMSCKMCDPGSYSGMQGQGTCTLCSTGMFMNETQATACFRCPVTTYQNATGQTGCLDCELGTFSMNDGQPDCTPCNPGRFTDQKASTECVPCPVGTFAGTAGNIACKECPAGKDTTTEGLMNCTDCVPGRAGLHCQACEAGRYQNNTGGTECPSCARGTYSDEPTSGTGAKFCLNCPAGTFGENPRGNITTCTACAEESTSLAGAPGLENCTCLATTYGSLENGTGPVCHPCPGCAVCPGGTTPKSPYGCFVSKVEDSPLYVAAVCSPVEACIGDSQCAPEYEGSVCSKCRAGHYRVNGRCFECPNYASAFWLLMVILLFVITLVLLRLSRPNLSKIASISIFLSGVQIISVFGYLPVPYPDTTVQMFKALSIANFNLDLFSPECSTKMNFYGLWLFKLALPLFFAASLGIVYACIKYIPRCRFWFYYLMNDVDPKLRGKMVTKDNFATPGVEMESEVRGEEVTQDYIPRDTDRFAYCVVSMMTLLYTFLSSTAAQPFACVLVGKDYVLARDVSQLCYTDEWKGYATVGGIMMVVYMIGIPASLFFCLFRGNQRNKIQEIEFLSRFGSLVVAYRSQFYFWDIFDMIRKAGVVLCITFLPNATDADKTLQINLIFLLTFAFLLAQGMTSPFEYNFCNRLCFIWLTVTLLTLISALLFQSAGLEESDFTAYAVFLLILVLSAMAATLYVTYRELRRMRWRAVMERRTGVSTLNRRKMQRTLLGQIFEGFSHDVWRKMRIYNDEESLKFFHYLAQGQARAKGDDNSGGDWRPSQEGLVHRTNRSATADKNLISAEDLQESDKIAHSGGLDVGRAEPNLMA